jgi:hypothetical protein
MGDCALYTQDIFPLAWSHSHWSRRNRAPPWNVLAGTGMQQRPPLFIPPHTAFHCRLRLSLHHGQAHRIGPVRKARCDTVYPTRRGGRGRGERGVRRGVFQSFPGPAFLIPTDGDARPRGGFDLTDGTAVFLHLFRVVSRVRHVRSEWWVRCRCDVAVGWELTDGYLNPLRALGPLLNAAVPFPVCFVHSTFDHHQLQRTSALKDTETDGRG